LRRHVVEPGEFLPRKSGRIGSDQGANRRIAATLGAVKTAIEKLQEAAKAKGVTVHLVPAKPGTGEITFFPGVHSKPSGEKT
jgi:hypothetical protein